MRPNCGAQSCALPLLGLTALLTQDVWWGEGNPPVTFTPPPRICSVQKLPTVSPAGPLVPGVTVDDVTEMMLGWTSSAPGSWWLLHQPEVCVKRVHGSVLPVGFEKNHFKKAGCILGRL